MSVEQAGRTWIFAEMLAWATKILGSQEAAERWLEHLAIGLDRKSPIDPLATPAGTRMVDDYLTRIEYGVYTSRPFQRRSAAKSSWDGAWSRTLAKPPGTAASARPRLAPA